LTGLPQLRVRLLGGLDVEGVGGPGLGSRKARTLVKVLALARGTAVPADSVVEALWPDDEDTPARPVEQVGVLVSRLRSATPLQVMLKVRIAVLNRSVRKVALIHI